MLTPDTDELDELDELDDSVLPPQAPRENATTTRKDNILNFIFTSSFIIKIYLILAQHIKLLLLLLLLLLLGLNQDIEPCYQSLLL